MFYIIDQDLYMQLGSFMWGFPMFSLFHWKPETISQPQPQHVSSRLIFWLLGCISGRGDVERRRGKHREKRIDLVIKQNCGCFLVVLGGGVMLWFYHTSWNTRQAAKPPKHTHTHTFEMIWNSRILWMFISFLENSMGTPNPRFQGL